MRAIRLLAHALIAITIAMPASAVTKPLRSIYTSLDPDLCQLVEQSAARKVWQCQGLPGYPVFYSEHNGRSFVSFGVPSKTGLATLSHGAKLEWSRDGRRRAAIEWRVVYPEGKPIPYATIIRRSAPNSSAHADEFVVTKVSTGISCVMYQIDASRSDRAVVEARSLADKSRTGSCHKGRHASID